MSYGRNGTPDRPHRHMGSVTRTVSPMSIAASGSFTEERGRTFILPRLSDDVDASAEFDPTIDSFDTERMVTLINHKFDMKEREIKNDIRAEFEGILVNVKREHEEKMQLMKRDMSNLTKVSLECSQLKEVQKVLRRELNEQKEKIQALSQENNRLRANASQTETLSSENRTLKVENDLLKKENAKLETEVYKLTGYITDKESEIHRLKIQIDAQYKKLKLDLTNTRDKFQTDQASLHAGMKKQADLLSHISGVVNNISNDQNDNATKKRTVAQKTISALDTTSKASKSSPMVSTIKLSLDPYRDKRTGGKHKAQSKKK